MSLGFYLVRQSREQDTVSKTHANMSAGGHVLSAPFNFEMAYAPIPPPPPPNSQSSKAVVSAALFAGMKSENPRSVLLSSVYNVL